MIALDTNVLARFLYHQDDPAQTERAVALITEHREKGDTFFVADVVLCELVWIFDSAFRLGRDEIAHHLDMLLRTRQIELESKAEVVRALEAYRQGKGDFADYLIREKARSRGCEVVATFDRALRRDEGFRVL